MKPILRTFIVISAIFLVYSCSGGGSTPQKPDAPTQPTSPNSTPKEPAKKP